MVSRCHYSGVGLVLLQDTLLCLLASLLSVLLVRWLSEPIPAFTSLALSWLTASRLKFFNGKTTWYSALARGTIRLVHK